MAVPTRRILDPIFGKPTLRAANNGYARWSKVNALSQWQKGTGWQANLYGGVQTGDDWGAVFIPVNELAVTSFNSALWSYYMTGSQSMGVNIVIWVHDPKDFSKRAEISQIGGAAGLGKAAGWNSHVFNTATTQMFFYGENTIGTGLTAGTQYTWAQFQADVLFKDWDIYRISLEYGWEASSTFADVWVVECKLNGQSIPFAPSDTELESVGAAGFVQGAQTTNANTRVQLSSTYTPCQGVLITAKPANTGYVYVGDGNVASSAYVARLEAGDAAWISCGNLQQVYIDVSVNTEGVNYGYLV
jgi:hypothetical protein